MTLSRETRLRISPEQKFWLVTQASEKEMTESAVLRNLLEKEMKNSKPKNQFQL